MKSTQQTPQQLKGKVKWQAWVELPSGVTFIEGISVKDVRKFMRANPETSNVKADVVNKYVIPLVSGIYKTRVVKSIKIKRLK